MFSLSLSLSSIKYTHINISTPALRFGRGSLYNILLKKKKTKASKDFYNCVRQTGLVNKTLKGGAVGNGGLLPYER